MATKLVCTVGTGKCTETTYHFGGATKTTNLAPIAVGCCAARPNESLDLVALLTDEAEAMYGEQLMTEAEEEGWICTKVGIPRGKSEEELWKIFKSVGDRLEDGDDIILDLTHGFQHIPALLLSATQYYAVRKELNLLGIFYGAWEARNEDNESPIFDLTPLYDLSEWTYGIRLLRDYQFPAPLGKMLEETQRRSHKSSRYESPGFTKLQKLGRPLKNLTPPTVSGVPLEAGFAADKALKNAVAAEKELEGIPPMIEPWQELKEQLEAIRLQSSRKGGIELILEELERQGRLIAGYLEVGNLWAAANVMREWVVSAVIFHSGNRGDWLKLKQRELVGRKLGARSYWCEKDFLKEALSLRQRELIKLWNGITERRNVLAHAGMREKNTNFNPDGLREPFEKLKTKLEDADFWNLEVSGGADEAWLISPLGATPGALFTAIRKTAPDRLLVITSERGKDLIPDVLREAGREDLVPRLVLLDDPFNGFHEVREKRLTEKLLKEHGLDWIRAKTIVVNLTGGTTCLGWAVGELETTLAKLGLSPGTAACIDRRSPEEQRRDPYAEGEMIEIKNHKEE